MPVKESDLEQAFVNTLSILLADRDRVAGAVSMAVAEAIAEVGEITGQDLSGEIRAVGVEIETLQAKIVDLSNKRARRELDTEQYNAQNGEVIKRLERCNKRFA